MTASILVVDDESTTQDTLGIFLETEGYRVATAGSGEEALARIEAQEFDLILADVVMPGVSGFEVLERSRVLHPGVAVILMTGHATVEMAIEALRKGACDYLQKPFVLHDLARVVQRLLRRRPGPPAPALPARARPALPGEDLLIGDSAALRLVREQIARIAPAPSNVLITGESGTGKELVARALHAASPRRQRKLVPLNCGAIPDSLLESQLFGHVRGAFTSAVQANPGLFVTAQGGTLFLDEIAELPMPLQAKLLRVIEEKQVWAVGATRPQPVDVRIVASTNRDLAADIEAGRFRADLFYRLNVVHIVLPPLRERREDIPVLVEHLVRRLNAKLHRRVTGIEPEAMQVLLAYGWKGNVRELEHVLEQAMILGDDDVIGLRDLAGDVVGPTAAGRPTDLRLAVRRFTRDHILDVLSRTGYDKRAAARVLGISLASLYRKLNVEPPEDDEPE